MSSREKRDHGRGTKVKRFELCAKSTTGGRRISVDKTAADGSDCTVDGNILVVESK